MLITLIATISSQVAWIPTLTMAYNFVDTYGMIIRWGSNKPFCNLEFFSSHTKYT